MKYILSIGVLALTPALSYAHDGEHVSNQWYQHPAAIALTLGGLLAVVWLVYVVTKKQRTHITVSAIALALAVTTYAGFATLNTAEYEPQLAVADFGAGQAVTLYKSPNCGCCTGHAKALEDAGFVVTIEETNNLDAVKQSYNIPPGGESCHTSVIGDYVVEGHVPLEAIEKLLDEQPDIAGIGLAGMPIGTPGMPGRKNAPYEIYQLLNTGDTTSFLTL